LKQVFLVAVCLLAPPAAIGGVEITSCHRPTYRPPGGVHTDPAASAAVEVTPPTPPAPEYQAVSEQLKVVKNLKTAVEALQRRLNVQEQTCESLAQANDTLVSDVEALRKFDSHEEERWVARPRRKSGDKIKTDKKKRAVTKDKAVHKDEKASAASSSSSDDSVSVSYPTSFDEDKSGATDTSSSDDGHGLWARRRPRVGSHRATARAILTQQRESGPLSRTSARSGFKKPIESR